MRSVLNNEFMFRAFGILLFEMMCGHTPFVGKNQQAVFTNIVHSQKNLVFGRRFDAHAKSLIRKLLNANPSIRIGCLRNGSADVKEHALFAGINFDDLLNGRIASIPFIPSKATENIANELNIHDHRHGDLSDMINLQEELSMENIPSPFDSFWANITVEQNI